MAGAQVPGAEPSAAREGGFAGAVSGGLTANEAGRRAAETSAAAAGRREQIVIAEAARERIIWESAPRLALTAQYTRLSPVDPPDVSAFLPEPTEPMTGDEPEVSFVAPPNNYLLNARLTLPLSDYILRLVRALRGARFQRDAAAIEESAARVTASSNAKLAYYDWVRARLEGVLAQQSLSTANAQSNRMRALESVGRAAAADVLQARAFEANAELALRQAQTQERIAEERLRIAMHSPPEERLEIGEDVLAAFPAADEGADLEALYREAVAKRLEVQALGKGREALVDAEGVESSRALPRLDAFGSVTYANPNQRIFPIEERFRATWDLGVTLTWAVNDVGSAATQARTVRAQLAQTDAQLQQIREGLRLEVTTALGALNQARVNVATAEDGERAAAAAYTARERLQEQGMATTLELMQAETARIQARLNVINAHIGLRVARVQLDHAVGRDAVAFGAAGQPAAER